MSSNFQNTTDPGASLTPSEKAEIKAPEGYWQGQLQGMVFQYGDSLRREERVDLTPFLELLAQCVGPESLDPTDSTA
jgi:hypothetical protein